MNELASRLADVLERIDRARSRRGDGASVRLLGVSKKQSIDAIREAHAAGLRDFGENYAQELRDKRRATADLELRWHFIGPIQSNKVKYVTGVSLLHTIDRTSLLDELQERADRDEVFVDTLVQVNVGGEPQKSGIDPVDIPAILDHYSGTPRVRCVGFMTIPPVASPEETRAHFRTLAELRQRWAREARSQVDLRELSMGMSDDFEVAIEEGSTLVRVGTAIFGARAPSSTEPRSSNCAM